MTHTLPTTGKQSYLPATSHLLGIVLDTATAERERLKSLVAALFGLFPPSFALTTFLIAASDGIAFPIPVEAERLEKVWNEIVWGKTPDVAPGLATMQRIIETYNQASEQYPPESRTVLLTEHGPPLSFVWGNERLLTGVLGKDASSYAIYHQWETALAPRALNSLYVLSSSVTIEQQAQLIFSSLD